MVEEEFETNSSQLSLFIIMGLGITSGEDGPTSLWQNCHFNVSSHAFLFSNCCARHTPLMQAVLKKRTILDSGIVLKIVAAMKRRFWGSFCHPTVIFHLFSFLFNITIVLFYIILLKTFWVENMVLTRNHATKSLPRKITS